MPPMMSIFAVLAVAAGCAAIGKVTSILLAEWRRHIAYREWFASDRVHRVTYSRRD